MGEAVRPLPATYIPFTRIKGISERRRMPIIGKIRLGVKVNGKHGMYLHETPYFILPPEIAQQYGEKTTELDVIFLLDDEERMFPQALKMYGESGLKCIGNGETASRLNMQTYRFEPQHCPCEFLNTKACNKRANLLVMLPQISSGGLYQIDSSSQDSIDNINGYFEFLKTTLGRIANIPLKLRRVPHLSRWQGQLQTHYPLVLRYEGTPELTAQLKADTKDVLAKLRLIEVQEPIEMNPAADPEATIVAEEDLASVMTMDQQPTAHTGPVTPSAEPPSPSPTSPVTSHEATPITATTDTAKAKQAEPMTAPQRNFILSMVASKQITPAQVDAITTGYNKRQASTLINQLKDGDFSGFEDVGEEHISLTQQADSQPPKNNALDTVEF